MPIKFPLLGGGIVVFLGGGGVEVPILFLWARKRHINFEHINFLKVGTTLGQPAS